MTNHQCAALQLLIEAEWMEAKADCAAAGKPFGGGSGIHLWVEFGQVTTVN